MYISIYIYMVTCQNNKHKFSKLEFTLIMEISDMSQVCLCPRTTHTCVWNSSVISVQVRPRSHRVVNRRLVDVYLSRESRCARQTQQCEKTSSCYLRRNKLRIRRSLNLNVCFRKISIYSGSKSILV